MTPLHIICTREDTRALAELFFAICDDEQQQVRIDTQDNLGNTPLHLAVEKGNKWAVEILLRRGADPNSANEDGNTPLHVIFGKGSNDELAEIFCKICDERHRPLKHSALDKLGNTPLHLAAERADKKAVELLLRRGVNPSVHNAEGSTPLHIVCKGNSDNYDLAFVFFELSDAEFGPPRVSTRDDLGNDRCTWLWLTATRG
ncbi:unnamed protein product [Trichogramma brassicae]|uniref:Uncharacterized protein n=1 Tax=Trichogramma brassicae TaxID=86971 RepID=A0A6H5IZ08_9HYME|nr:unnamed protein product [Trichogramma brassicae]